MKHLTPKFTVELQVLKKKHFYKATVPTETPGAEITALYPGTTGFLQIINKPAVSMWMKKQALESVQGALTKHLYGMPEMDMTLTKEWIDDILKEAKAKPDKIKDDAADLGTLVHKYIDQIILGKMPTNLTPEMEPAVTAFIEWWKDSKIELVMGDTKVASLIHGYGGSLDALGRQNGEYVILDWKTSNGIYDEYALQLAAYWQAFRETFGPTCARGYIVRFSKRLPVTIEVREVANLETSFQAFLAAKNLTQSMGVKHFL